MDIFKDKRILWLMGGFVVILVTAMSLEYYLLAKKASSEIKHVKSVAVSNNEHLDADTQDTKDESSTNRSDTQSSKPGITTKATASANDITIQTCHLEGGFLELHVFSKVKDSSNDSNTLTEQFNIGINPAIVNYKVERQTLIISDKRHPDRQIRIFPNVGMRTVSPAFETGYIKVDPVHLEGGFQQLQVSFALNSDTNSKAGFLEKANIVINPAIMQYEIKNKTLLITEKNSDFQVRISPQIILQRGCTTVTRSMNNSFHTSPTVPFITERSLEGGFKRLQIYLPTSTLFTAGSIKKERIDLTINPVITQYSKVNNTVILTNKKHSQWRLTIYPAQAKTQADYGALLKSVINPKYLGKIILGNGTGVINAPLWRVSYQTEGNMFYTTNFKGSEGYYKANEGQSCTVMSFTEPAPCAWMTISMSTHEYITVTLECGSNKPNSECLDFGDTIARTIHFYGIVQ